MTTVKVYSGTVDSFEKVSKDFHAVLSAWCNYLLVREITFICVIKPLLNTGVVSLFVIPYANETVDDNEKPRKERRDDHNNEPRNISRSIL